MEINIRQDKLSKALNNVSKVVSSSRAILPILNNVLIRVNDKQVTFITTNLDMAMVSYIPSPSSENGAITVPARLLADFVSNLPKGENVKITADGTQVVIQAGEYNSQINGAVADDFPELPEIDESKMTRVKVGVEDFKDSLTQVMVATSNDTTRPALTGVYFNTYEGGLYFAATDGYRLAERKVVEKIESEITAIVPAASLRSVMGLLTEDIEDVEILFDESQVRFRLGDIEVTSKLIEGSFPDYRQLIPKESEIEIELNKDELTRVTKLAALFAKEVGGSITCVADSEKKIFEVASVANELGKNSSGIKAEITTDGKITLNSRFLLDALNVLDEKKIQFKFSNNLNPIILKAVGKDNYIHIVMPLKG